MSALFISKRRKKEREDELIKQGTHVRLTTGEIVEVKYIHLHLYCCNEYLYISSHWLEYQSLIRKSENFPHFNIENYNRFHADYESMKEVYLFIKKQIAEKEKESFRKQMEESRAEQERIRQQHLREFEKKKKTAVGI